MASFKGDHNYRVHHDDVNHVDSNSEEDEAPLQVNTLRKWVDANYEVLEELFDRFKSDGRKIFGQAFYQLGGFHQFVHFVHAYTLGANSDLLKAK